MIYRKGPQWSFPKQHNKISMKQVKRLTQVFDDFKHYSIVEWNSFFILNYCFKIYHSKFKSCILKGRT